ncbi:phosphatase PAP2 family protein [Rariglobus hedericola]|uniref:Phosphatase PAP2 family protein n=1 Tax=Rariglobus hedericola TaxID=2597822 RepID=A0A556QN80_9BACT|nr:phosphatase PAP2 family protein [Rariglobus hedericola]TSJ78101.1 phosphatase PAP2 family protein [Rariglobus hedericola]
MSPPSVRTRIATYHWRKATTTPVLMVAFFVIYFQVLNHPLSPPVQVPHTAPDRWISFQPWALIPYASLWLYVIIPSALMMRLRELRDHALGAIALGGIGLLIFILWPTITPPSHIDWSAHPQMQFLKNIDASGNACPSLHVAFAVFGACWLARVLRRMHAGTFIQCLNVLWAVAIAYSTIATRQHVALDVLAGAALGWIVAAINLRLCPDQPDV